jgi:hypothetical protein
MMPFVVKEESIKTFNFYLNGSVRQGMVCQNKLYKLVSSFEPDDCPRAYALGWSLGCSGTPAVITLAEQGYGVWIDLRSQAKDTL